MESGAGKTHGIPKNSFYSFSSSALALCQSVGIWNPQPQVPDGGVLGMEGAIMLNRIFFWAVSLMLVTGLSLSLAPEARAQEVTTGALVGVSDTSSVPLDMTLSITTVGNIEFNRFSLGATVVGTELQHSLTVTENLLISSTAPSHLSFVYLVGASNTTVVGVASSFGISTSGFQPSVQATLHAEVNPLYTTMPTYDSTLALAQTPITNVSQLNLLSTTPLGIHSVGANFRICGQENISTLCSTPSPATVDTFLDRVTWCELDSSPPVALPGTPVTCGDRYTVIMTN